MLTVIAMRVVLTLGRPSHLRVFELPLFLYTPTCFGFENVLIFGARKQIQPCVAAPAAVAGQPTIVKIMGPIPLLSLVLPQTLRFYWCYREILPHCCTHLPMQKSMLKSASMKTQAAVNVVPPVFSVCISLTCQDGEDCNTDATGMGVSQA